MITIGLGTQTLNDQILGHTLNHLEGKTQVEVMDELRKADTLARNTELANIHMETAAALLATKKQSNLVKHQKTGKYHCNHHGHNRTHDSKDCLVLKGKAKAKETAQIADDEPGPNVTERAAMAGVSHIASPPRTRPPSSKADYMWNADSGATSHMTPHREWIRDMIPCRIPVHLANNHIVWATGRGNVMFTPTINGRPAETVMLERVLYVPSLQNNLFAILSAVRRSKLRVVIEDDKLVFSTRDTNPTVIFTGTVHGNVAMLNGITLNNSEQALITRVSKDLLHQRLGHIGKDRLERMIRQDLVDGIKVISSTKVKDVCEHCITGKQHRDPFPKLSDHRSNEKLELIHSDLHGPLPRTPHGYEYWITFTDDYSRFKEVYPLKNKDEAFGAFKKYVEKVEGQFGSKVKGLRDDKGGEYIGKEFGKWCDDRGIIRQHTVKATPQQNSVSERLNRTLAEGIVAMLN